MSDLNSDLLTQEVDDEVRRENMRKAWKAYRKYVFGIAAAIILGVSGHEAYEYQVKKTQEANSTAFAAAVAEAEAEGADVVAAWKAALPGLKGNYKGLGELRLAAAAVKAGDMTSALAAYDAVAADDNADESLRDLAQLQAGMVLADRDKDFAGARSRLGIAAIKGRAWYHSAQEQLALIDLQQGDLDAALIKFSGLADDGETPQTIKARAAQFRSFVEARQGLSAATGADAQAADAPETEKTTTQETAQ